MLHLAAQWHRVYLACFHDDPVHLAQWCMPHHFTEGMVMACPSVRGCTLDLLLIHGDRYREMDRNVTLWPRQCAFDLVLCTHPQLTQTGSIVDARYHACDVRTPRGIIQVLRAVAPLPALWHRDTERSFIIKQAA